MIKKLLLFLILFFAISFLSSFFTQNKASADVTLCSVKANDDEQETGDCLGAWNNEIRLPIGHILTQADVNEIIAILSEKGFFKNGSPNFLEALVGFFTATDETAEEMAKQATEKVLRRYAAIRYPWNQELQSKIQADLAYEACLASKPAGIGSDECPDPKYPRCTPGDNCEFAVCNDTSGICNSKKCDRFTNKCVYGTTQACIGSGKYFLCNTGIGPINADPSGFARSILRIFLGLAGGILLILIILNGYKLMTSQGDPEKIKDAREGIIAAIAGILLIIFSLSILRLITSDILGIPGFS